ncbi:MAG: prolipoprotein diacylglyceryl transferase [Candidatus Glassbacteria bacterium]|nr:prolipoprotein diacylglyceryl transferase [Candidatus Glassbacteria bacterium]
MYPVLFKIGPLEVKTYGLMLVVSFVVGYLTTRPRVLKKGIDQDVLLDLCFYILLSAIVGSRIFYAVTHLSEYSDNPLSIFYIWEGGLSMMGGILLSLAVSWLYLKLKEIDFYLMADLLSPAIALGVALTRVGCFLYGCCYGLPCELPWAVQFPAVSAAGSHFHQPIHPAQLYAVAYGLLIFAILLLVERRRPPAGVMFGSLLVLYGTARFTVDFFRYYEPQQYILSAPLPLTNNQLICLGLFAFGCYRILAAFRTRRAGGG